MKFIVSFNTEGLTENEIKEADKKIDKICTDKANEILSLMPAGNKNFKYDGNIEIPNKGIRKYIAFIVEDNFKDFHLL